jgi:hypothetical protein
MSPSFGYGARGQVYRYYVSAPLQQGRCAAPPDGAIRRVPAPAIEAKLVEAMARLAPASETAGADPLMRLHRVEVHPTSLQLLVPITLLAAVSSRLGDGEQAMADAAEPSRLRLILPVRMRLRGGRVWILGANEKRPAAAKRDPILIKALRSAHSLLSETRDGLPTLRTAPANPYARKIVRLAFLAPALQAAILDGRQPAGLTLERLIQSPPALLWDDQTHEF